MPTRSTNKMAPHSHAITPADNTDIAILIVDDDQEICDYMRTLLEQDQFRVTTVHDPLIVENILRTQHFHIVILDIMMPAMDGIELLSRIRKFDSDIAAIIFTGYPNLETAVESMKLQADDYIKKPFSVDELRRALQRVIDKRNLRRSPEQCLHQQLGQTIRSLRNKHALTLNQLARRTGLSLSLLSQIERAQTSPSISSLYRIACALNVTVPDLFNRQ